MVQTKKRSKPKKLLPVIQQLKKWREANGLSQRQAASVLETQGLLVTVTALQKWEGGFRKPERFTAKVLETFFAAHPVVTDAPKYGRWKVPDDQVKEIKALRSQGVSLLSIGERFGVSESAVSRIANGNRRSVA